MFTWTLAFVPAGKREQLNEIISYKHTMHELESTKAQSPCYSGTETQILTWNMLTQPPKPYA